MELQWQGSEYELIVLPPGVTFDENNPVIPPGAITEDNYQSFPEYGVEFFDGYHGASQFNKPYKFFRVNNPGEFHNAWIVSNYIQEMETYSKYIKSVMEWFKHLRVDNNGWFTQRLFPDTIYDILQSFPEVEYGIFSTKNITCVIDLLQYSIVVPIEKLEHPKFTFKQALLRLCVVWLETVEPVFNNIRREKILFKDLVVYVAKHKNKVDIPDIVKLKSRHNDILNFYRLISAVCCLRDAYSNKIYKLSGLIETMS